MERPATVWPGRCVWRRRLSFRAAAAGTGGGGNDGPPVMVDLKGSVDLDAGTTTVRAGESVTRGGTTLSCPAGGGDCALTVEVDPVTGVRTATGTGGRLTVTVAAPAPPADLAGTRAAAVRAHEAAKAALAAVEADRDADRTSYDDAARAVAAAKAASDRAASAATLAEARAARDAAEAARAEAVRFAERVGAARDAGLLAAVRREAADASVAAGRAADGVMRYRALAPGEVDAAKAGAAAARAASDRAAAATTLAAARAAKAEAERARTEAERQAGLALDRIRPALNKAALSMEKAIGEAKMPVTSGAYGFRTGPNQEQLENASILDDGRLVLVFNWNQNRVRGDLPAVLRDIGGRWNAAVYVRTTEDSDAGTVTRDSRILVDNEENPNDPSYGFGMWMNETEKDGVVTHNNVQGWTGVPGRLVDNADGNSILLTKTGGGASNNNKLSGVEGTATYSGPAIGAYVHKTLKQGVLDRASAGVFRADAELKVRFGGSGIPSGDQFDIDGTVSNFRLSGGEENAWTLKLAGDNFLADNFAFFEYDQGVTSADNVAKKGSFTAVFLEDKRSLAARKAGDATVVPGSIQGRFTGHFLNGLRARRLRGGQAVGGPSRTGARPAARAVTAPVDGYVRGRGPCPRSSADPFVTGWPGADARPGALSGPAYDTQLLSGRSFLYSVPVPSILTSLPYVLAMAARLA